MFAKALQWLMYSSENASKISRTVKGFSVFVPTLVILLSLVHMNVDQDSILSVINQAVEAITAIGVAGSAIYTLFAAIVKVSTTVRGENDVVGSWER